MSKRMLVVGDSDALISTFYRDSNHELVKEILRKFSMFGAEVIFPCAIIVEAITTCHRKLEDPRLATSLIQKLTSELIVTVPTDVAILKQACLLFDPNGSKENTFFDAVVAATAKLYGADMIFSFDRWYKKKGFTLAQEFL